MSTLDLRDAARAVSVSVAHLPTLSRAAVGTWRGRMVNEHGSARVFDGLAGQLSLAGLGTREAEVRGFAEEERRHGVLCGAVVEALGGEALAPALVNVPYPTHPDIDPREAVLRNALSIGCLSETVAVALIGAERDEMPDGPLRDLLTHIWADEIGHARFGWGLVPELYAELDEAGRARTARYLTVALAALQEHELAHLPMNTFPDEGKSLGLCNGADARRLFFATVNEVILPGLARFGLAPGALRQVS